jgi:hypothetical protein
MTEVTGGQLLTLWKVGRVELPKIAQVYLDAIDGLSVGIAPAQPRAANCGAGNYAKDHDGVLSGEDGNGLA